MMNRGYIELDDLQYIIEPISNNYSKEGHVIYHPSDHVMFEPEMRQKLNKTCHVKDDTKKISLGFSFKRIFQSLKIIKF